MGCDPAPIRRFVTMRDIQSHVEHIARTLIEGFDPEELNVDGEPFCAFDYLQDALDIEYIVNGKGEYLGAHVLVAFGGPNIWINTRTQRVEGAWWGDSATAPFTDNIGLEEALTELWACR
jgi:hypothetical protein